MRNDFSALDLFNFGCLPTLLKNWFSPWQRFVTNSTEKRSSTPLTACFDGNGGIIHPWNILRVPSSARLLDFLGFLRFYIFRVHILVKRNASQSTYDNVLTMELRQHKLWVAPFHFHCPIKWWRHVRWRHRAIYNESFSGNDNQFFHCFEKGMSEWTPRML